MSATPLNLSPIGNAGCAVMADVGSGSAAERAPVVFARKAFVLQLRPGCADEYERRHNRIWPELEHVLRQHGVQRYSIFLCEETHQLFACLEIEDLARWNLVAQTPEMLRWRRYMADVLEYDPAEKPVVTPLREVFNFM